MRARARNDGGSVFWSQPAGTSLGRVVTWSGRTLNVADRSGRLAAMVHMDIKILVVVVVAHCDGLPTSVGSVLLCQLRCYVLTRHNSTSGSVIAWVNVEVASSQLIEDIDRSAERAREVKVDKQDLDGCEECLREEYASACLRRQYERRTGRYY